MKKFLVLLVAAFFTFLGGKAEAKSLDRAMISFTFDDGPNSLLLAVPILSKYKIQGTAYIVPDWVGDGEHLTWAQLWSLFWKDGWEIGNHSFSHQHLTTLSDAQIKAEIESAQTVFLQHGLLGQGAFASPYGEFDDRLLGILRGVGFITSSRQAWTEDSAFNDPLTFNEWAINVVSIRRTTTYAKIKSLIDQAVAGEKWLVLVIHDMAQYPMDDYEMSTSVLSQTASYVSTLRTYGKIDGVPLSKAVGKMLYYQGLP
ncbi:MAG: polysaccharide deacetylase family protein [Patescibacteria group bacterium]